MTQLARRQFLKRSSGAVAAALTAASGPVLLTPAAAWAETEGAEPLFKISLAQWSLNRRFFKREEPHLDPLEFAAISRKLGIDAIEYVNQFFMDKAEDAAYLADLNRRAADAGVKNLLIMIDREGDLGDPDTAARDTAVKQHHKWVQAAKTLGCHSIRVNAKSKPTLSFNEQMKLAADGLRKLTEFAATHELNVIVENHGGLSSNGTWLVGVMKLVDHPRCGTLPDFGNFAIDRRNNLWYDRYKGVKEMMPFAKAVSAKAYAFDDRRPFVTIDERSGKETDFLRMMRIVLEAGYRGYVGIESEGGMDQMEGIRKTHELLLRVRERLTPEFARP